jgi:hypothetical protein
MSSGFDRDKTPKAHQRILTFDLHPEVKQEEVYLSFEDFCAIDFGLHGNEQFKIINDVMHLMTGL